MPLFLKALPQSTGKTFRSMVAWRMPAFSSAMVGVSPSRNFSSSTSSVSAITSINCRRKASAFFCSAAGIGSMENSAPMVSSCQTMACISIRSMTPLKLASAPMGICNATGRAPRRLRMRVQNVLEVGAVLVHLVDEADARHLVLVALPPHGLRSAAARRKRNRTAPPRRPARAGERSTSAVKSTWPGVSMILMR